MKTVMCSHLDALISHFEKYFSEDMEKHNWIRNYKQHEVFRNINRNQTA